MKIEQHQIKVRDLAKSYKDDKEGGVRGYDGKLDIRPPFQREFVYGDKQRAAVIQTVKKGFPLNVMYWALREDGTFEVIDGQQRTISICQYVNSEYSVDDLYIHNLPSDKREEILDYELTIYFCSGSDSEKLDWFQTINIAGATLTNQELLNAIYCGPWVSDAKRHFSRTGCPAYSLGSDYLSGVPIRQDYFETVVNWISHGEVRPYMAQHQFTQNANVEWLYFQSVINWVKISFPNYRREMKGVPWGQLYNKYKDENLDVQATELRIAELMADEDVTNKKGIYEYVLSGHEKYLNIRSFTPNQKREAYEMQEGICVKCGHPFLIEAMEADHITPWSEGGKTDSKNCQLLCKEDNRRKSNT